MGIAGSAPCLLAHAPNCQRAVARTSAQARLVDDKPPLLDEFIDRRAAKHLTLSGEKPQVFVAQSPVAQRGDQGCALGAHALGLEVELGQFRGLDTAPQRDGIVDPDVVGQFPVT